MNPNDDFDGDLNEKLLVPYEGDILFKTGREKYLACAQTQLRGRVTLFKGIRL